MVNRTKNNIKEDDERLQKMREGVFKISLIDPVMEVMECSMEKRQ